MGGGDADADRDLQREALRFEISIAKGRRAHRSGEAMRLCMRDGCARFDWGHAVMNRRKRTEATERFEERRRREDGAPRLCEEVPRLETLRLQLEHFRHGNTSPLVSHTRVVVVARAPALFIVPCSDPDCDGSHDLTREMMRLLRASEGRPQGEDECFGTRNNATCRNLLRYQGLAHYTDPD